MDRARGTGWRGYNRAIMAGEASQDIRFCAASDHSLLVYFEEETLLAAHRRVVSLTRALERSPLPGVCNLHPAFRSLLVKFDAVERTHAEIEAKLRDRLAAAWEEGENVPRLVEIPVSYGGEFGPDLEEVARLHAISEQELIERHAGGEYLVFFLGFVPGFAYLGELSEELATPRLETPRKAVPAGSVAIAGRQTGVYPFRTPGGWRLLGRTPLRMFERTRREMSLLQLGDHVKFVPISSERCAELERP